MLTIFCDLRQFSFSILHSVTLLLDSRCNNRTVCSLLRHLMHSWCNSIFNTYTIQSNFTSHSTDILQTFETEIYTSTPKWLRLQGQIIACFPIHICPLNLAVCLILKDFVLFLSLSGSRTEVFCVVSSHADYNIVEDCLI